MDICQNICLTSEARKNDGKSSSQTISLFFLNIFKIVLLDPGYTTFHFYDQNFDYRAVVFRIGFMKHWTSIYKDYSNEWSKGDPELTGSGTEHFVIGL